MIEKLNLWSSSDVEEKIKINEIIDELNAQRKEIEQLKLEFGVNDNE